MTQKKFHIEGLNCHQCVFKVKSALESLEGVQNVKVLQDENLVVLDVVPMPGVQELNELLEDYGSYKLSEL